MDVDDENKDVGDENKDVDDENKDVDDENKDVDEHEFQKPKVIKFSSLWLLFVLQ